MTIASGQTILASDINGIKDDVDAIVSAAQSSVTTSETTTSTSFTDLSTSGPAVTLTTGTTVLVAVSAQMFNSGAARNFMSFELSGASSTPAASVDRALVSEGTGTFGATFLYLVTGLTSGSNTFTAKYRVSAGTGTFADRFLSVIPIGD